MYCFATTHDVTVQTRAGIRLFQRTENEKEADPAHLYIATPGEERLVREKIATLHAKDESALQDSQDTGVRRVAEEALQHWKHMPMRLGRKNGVLLTDAEPLLAQLAQLRQRKPDQQHFRFAIINGFGTNLGDTLMGMTAMRCVVRHLALQFPSFAIDMLYGPDSAPGNVHMARAPWLEQQLFQGPSLLDFSRYDGWFDFSNLISETGFGERPVVDWYIWWMGLNPDAIDPKDKRNRLEITLSDWNNAATLLRQHAHPESVCIWFAPEASVKLRSIPHKEAQRIARGILDCAPQYILFADTKIIEHPRMVTLQRPSLQVYTALLAQLDGVITVDSVPTHIADAASTPCLTCYSCVQTSMYPYYPYSTAIPLQDYEQLPAYRRCKVSDEEWSAMESAYTQAWHKMRPSHIVEALQKRIEERKNTACPVSSVDIVANPSPRARTKVRTVSEPVQSSEHTFPYERNSERWIQTQDRLIHIAKGILPRGGVCILAGAGQSALPLAIAAHLGTSGTLHVVEPRRERLQLVVGDAAQAGLFTVQTHGFMPIESAQEATYAATDPLSETQPDHWGNMVRKVSSPCKSLDTLALPICHALLVQPPMPFASIFAGFRETLRTRPILVAAPIPKEETHAACLAIGTSYVFWASSIPAGDPNTATHYILLAIPKEKDANLEGFTKINIVP